jgi:hypothetical protein
MAIYSGVNINTSGLILSLDASSNRSYSGTGNTAYGLVGGIGGTLVNGVGFTSSNNGSFFFDGTDDYISIGVQPLIDGYQLPLTLSGWFKINALKLNSICGVYNGFANVYNLLRLDNSVYRFFLSNAANGQFQYFDHTATISINTWYFFAVTVSGSISTPSLSMYLNNTAAQTFSPLALKSSVGLNIDYRIGATYTGGENFQGNISQVQLYNRALSAQEIKNNFEATRDRYGI